jgi:RecB family exonuclease
VGAERYLFYATVSRPEARLYLTWHAATDEGDPAVRSAFVDDVVELFDGLEHRKRDLGAVGWAAGTAPTDREAARGDAHDGPRAIEPVAAPLSHPDVLQGLRERPAWSASGLEVWAGCPTKWFVERMLRPDGLEPDPEAMVRGSLAHAVLERALKSLVNGGGLTTAHLADAREAVRAALDELDHKFPMSTDPSRRRALRRRLEADLLRYVESAARSGTSFDPDAFEVTFEGLDIGDGIVIGGKIDRVDVRRGTREAIVYDYKGKTAYPGAKWVEEHRFQLAVYALAARQGARPRARRRAVPAARRRGPAPARGDAPRGRPRPGARRRRPPGRRGLRHARRRGRQAAAEAARQARTGALEARPESCAWGGGCAYPTICRCEDA